MFRTLIVPVIFIIWGALVALRVLFGEHQGGAYGAGGIAAGVFVAVMVFAGVRALMKRDRLRSAARQA